MRFFLNPLGPPFDITDVGGSPGGDVGLLTGDTGGAVGPDGSGNINLLGTSAQGVSSSGAGSTITWTIADASTTQKGVSELATDAESIAGMDAGRTVAPSSLKAKLGTQTSHGLPVGAGTTSAISWTAEPSNGQILIGSTGNAPVLATLSAGTGIIVTNSAGNIEIATEPNLSGTGTTTDASTLDLITLAISATPGSYLLQGRIIAYNYSAGNAGAVYRILAGFTSTGLAATKIDIEDKYHAESASLDDADCNIIASGATIIVRATGVAATTIKWKADFEYSYVAG